MSTTKGKRCWLYKVTESTCDEVKVGTLMVYYQPRGKSHSEMVMDDTGERVSYFAMEKHDFGHIIDGKYVSKRKVKK